jgi:hypothetical protein
MFQFNTKGHLIPYSNIPFTSNEFYNTFVKEIASERREKLYHHYVEFTNQILFLLQVDTLKQWINGSFTTKVLNPNDIDFVTFIDEAIFKLHSDKLRRFIRNPHWIDLGMDAYFVILRSKESSLFFNSESDRLYWLHHFTKVRNSKRLKHPNRKGFVEIIH